jgi:hypothetical protein
VADAVILPFPARHPAPRSFLDDRTSALCEVDRCLAILEESLALNLGWLRSARRIRSRVMARAAVQSIRATRRDIQTLERARLRLAGAELALLRGGRP